MDPLLRDFDPERSLPFEDAPAPDVFVSIFRQFWGRCGGLVLGPVSVETPNCGGGKIGKDSVELEDSLAVELEDSLAVELEEENWDVEKDVEYWDVEKDVEMKSKCRDAYATKCRAAGAGPPTPYPSIMTADTWLETQGSVGVEVIGPPAAWQFDFSDSFGDLFGGLTVEDTVTPMASKETLAWSSQGDKQEMGSYGVYGDAQRKSLRLVEESKDFARARLMTRKFPSICGMIVYRLRVFQRRGGTRHLLGCASSGSVGSGKSC
jgi:hypothetical protein